MSRFFHSQYRGLSPYTPGEQPRDMRYIKLNTNESPFPPAPGVLDAVNREELSNLRLYPDPELKPLREALAEACGLSPSEIFVSNGSDEALDFAFRAFSEDGIAFPDISYGFYPVFAALHHIQAEEKPLREDFSIAVEDYLHIGKALVLANPNAPTGLLLPREAIEEMLRANPDHVVIVDEAYIDFAEGGAEAASALPLVRKYKNLLLIRTFSKSRSLAGARLGYAIGDPALVQDLRTLKFSTNPYNVNRLSQAAGLAAVREAGYYEDAVQKIRTNRAFATEGLRRLGFRVLDSMANFVFAMHPGLDGEKCYQELKARGILVRRFDSPRIRQYNRITIGTKEDMEALIAALSEILLQVHKGGEAYAGKQAERAV